MSTTGNGQENLLYELPLLGLLAALWGSSYLLIKIAVATIPPITLIAMRVSLAAVFLLAVMWFQGARFPRDWSTWRMLLVQAFFNSIASWTVLAWGQQHVDSGLAGVLNSTSPIFVLIITLLFTRHEPVTAWKLTGALLGVVGVALIVGLDALRGLGQQIAGQLAVLLGALLYAFAAIYGKRFSSISPTVAAAGTMIWATACLGPLCLVADKPWTLNPSAHSVVAAVVLGLLSTGVATSLLPLDQNHWTNGRGQPELPSSWCEHLARDLRAWRTNHLGDRYRANRDHSRGRGDQHPPAGFQCTIPIKREWHAPFGIVTGVECSRARLRASAASDGWVVYNHLRTESR